MKKLVLKMMAVCAGALIVSCGSGKNMLSVSSLDGEWNITEVDGQKISTERMPFIGFDVAQKRIYGNSGCNRMMGSFEADSLKPGTLKFGQIGSTRMMCPDMKTEQMVLGALDKVTSFQTVSDKPDVITLCNQDGQPLMTLEKKAAPEVSLSDLSGEWVIELVNGKKIVGTAEVTPFIGFNLDESRIYGNVGCNTINGALMQEDGKPNSLRFDNVATTMMMCPDMETETIVLNALNETKSFSMKDDKVYLTDEGFLELEEELNELKNVKRPEVIKALKEARALGDLSENADYDAARAEQAQVEGRIQELEKIMENAHIIKKGSTDKVSLGTTVKIKYVDDDDIEEYRIVGSKEADPSNNKISNESPIAMAIMNAKAGEIRKVASPNGEYEVEIVEIC